MPIAKNVQLCYVSEQMSINIITQILVAEEGYLQNVSRSLFRD